MRVPGAPVALKRAAASVPWRLASRQSQWGARGRGRLSLPEHLREESRVATQVETQGPVVGPEASVCAAFPPPSPATPKCQEKPEFLLLWKLEMRRVLGVIMAPGKCCS